MLQWEKGVTKQKIPSLWQKTYFIMVRRFWKVHVKLPQCYKHNANVSQELCSAYWKPRTFDKHFTVHTLLPSSQWYNTCKRMFLEQNRHVMTALLGKLLSSPTHGSPTWAADRQGAVPSPAHTAHHHLTVPSFSPKRLQDTARPAHLIRHYLTIFKHILILSASFTLTTVFGLIARASMAQLHTKYSLKVLQQECDHTAIRATPAQCISAFQQFLQTLRREWGIFCAA